MNPSTSQPTGQQVPDPDEGVDMPTSRKRRANSSAGPRTFVHKIRLNQQEEERAQDLAAASGVTVARMFIEASLNQNTVPNRAVLLQLSGIRRTHQGIGNNLNQLARAANSGTRFTDEITDTIRTVRDVNTKLTEVIERNRRA